ncbi:MAG: FAD-dependent oxidoreductase [Anaerolineales bacterium]|nr:FAD-dependent oxidoreductase [Anaerolineales bacterium]
MLRIAANTDDQRISTQDLLRRIYAAMAAGETDFVIDAAGQHDIGGPLWDQLGRGLHFTVTNPGQRVGSMGMPGTEIVVEGPAPADVGWLNAGARIVVRGDGGDTAGHCAADGVIYIGGRAGARSGSLMKHDPAYPPPQLWILKHTGSFPFEFMGGGIAVVCGHDCEGAPSVLGQRACVGMVGGTVYVRGPVENLSPEVKLSDGLDDADWSFLAEGLPRFLEAVDAPELLGALTVRTEWRKITPWDSQERKRAQERLPLAEFRSARWVEGGIFGDVLRDDGEVAPLVPRGKYRSVFPVWNNAVFAAPCEYACPNGIPTQERIRLLREGRVREALELVLQYSPFPGSVCGAACPNPCMAACTRGSIDFPVLAGPLGGYSADLPAPEPAAATGKTFAVIGAGAAGLSAAWQLALRGHTVCVYDSGPDLGGKMFSVIPQERLDKGLVRDEIERLLGLGIEARTGVRVDRALFEDLRRRHDGVIIAAGATKPRRLSFPGSERALTALEFLRAENAGTLPIALEGKQAVVIGAGDVGMDVCAAAWRHGARKVTAVDVRAPASSGRERAAALALGTRILWPLHVRGYRDGILAFEQGQPDLPADAVVVAVGEIPELDWLPDALGRSKNDYLAADEEGRTGIPGIYAAGDAVKPGLLADAVGGGRTAALAAHADASGEPFRRVRKEAVPRQRLHLEYFTPQRGRAPSQPLEEAARCISCGTCRDCSICVSVCGQNAIRRTEEHGEISFAVDEDLCTGCGFCAAACPSGIWTMVPARGQEGETL